MALLRGKGSGFYPDPALQFQNHCPIHHHDVFPSQFCHKDDWRSGNQGMKICPACDWETRNWVCIDRAAFTSRYHDFRISYDASLPKYPILRDIFHTDNPVIRWIKSKKNLEDASRILEVELGPSDSTAAACLSGAGAAICPH